MRGLAMGVFWSLLAVFTPLVCATPVWADGELPPGSGPPGKTFAIVVVGVAVVLVAFVSWRMLRRIANSRKEWEAAADEYARHHKDPAGEEP